MKICKFVCLLLVLLLLFLVACAPAGGATDQTQTSELSGTDEPPKVSGDDDAWRIRVIGSAGEEIWSFTEQELESALMSLTALPSDVPGQFAHVYSTVNNWPTARFYAAEGYSVASILIAAGSYESAQTVTFRGNDGYEISLTRQQLLATQYCYPQVNESESGAEFVFPIVAYRWREGTDDLSSIRDDDPCLIIGQRDPFEHTNPAFVENISEIIVSSDPCETWPVASAFPMHGQIAKGETVKLQHPHYGLVKLHYTLDGSEPTMLSPMYNPSTYRPELNVPIPITGLTVIKVIACGYGKNDSEIAVFEFVPLD